MVKLLSERTSGVPPVIFSSDRSSYSDDCLLYIQRPLFQIFTQSIDAIDSAEFPMLKCFYIFSQPTTTQCICGQKLKTKQNHAIYNKHQTLCNLLAHKTVLFRGEEIEGLENLYTQISVIQLIYVDGKLYYGPNCRAKAVNHSMMAVLPQIRQYCTFLVHP